MWPRCLFAIDVTVCTCTFLRLLLSLILVSTGRTILSTSTSTSLSHATRAIDQVRNPQTLSMLSLVVDHVEFGSNKLFLCTRILFFPLAK